MNEVTPIRKVWDAGREKQSKTYKEKKMLKYLFARSMFSGLFVCLFFELS